MRITPAEIGGPPRRERALDAERQANQVALVVRNVSANISKAEAALARFVLDEDVKTSGNIYASDWQLAGHDARVAVVINTMFGVGISLILSIG